MKTPFDIGTADKPNIIDISQVTDIRPLSEELLRAKGIKSERPFTAEIRCGTNGGGYVEQLSIKDIVTAFKAQGVEMVHIAATDEAVRADWIVGVAAFRSKDQSREQIFHSKVDFLNPDTKQKTEAWFRAPVRDIPFGTAPGFSRTRGGPSGTGE